MVIRILNVENSCITRLSAIITAAVASMMAGCSTISGGFEDLLDESPQTNIEFSSADEIDYQGASVFERRFYGTLGAGGSRLKPNTDKADGVEVKDESDTGAQLGAGVDLSNTFSVELHAADLGSAALSPGGSISYETVGGSVLAYAGQERANRRGFLGYARAGITTISNESEGNIELNTDDSAKGLLGAGIEYMGQNLGIRGEIIVFDKDAQFAHLGVIYRLGGASAGVDELPENFPLLPPETAPNEASETQLPEPPIPQPPVTELPEPPIAQPPASNLPELPTTAELPSLPVTQNLPGLPASPTSTILDSDFDGIPDEFDGCPDTPLGNEVDDNGCAIFNGVVEGVNFERGSATLTADARGALNLVILTLRKHPDALIAISSHTDDIGKEDANLELSRLRAIAVARYMIARGVPKRNMSARAFGEFQPIADNSTAEGRAKNRRVEIVASKGKPR